ncbi:MAG: hypothetical protein L7T80_01175, partial [Arenicellales bacterium]|nr:hypothetical protein [Arenicellales bacterium]
MSTAFGGVSGAVRVSALLLVLSFFFAPAPDLAWRELGGVWIAMGTLAGLLVLGSIRLPAALWVHLLQFILLCVALHGVLGLVHADLLRGSAQLGFWLLVT